MLLPPQQLCCRRGRNIWFRRHSSHFEGEQIPLGCGIFFLPASTKTVVSKADPRMVWGIFLGYRLSPGGRWKGEYLTAELTEFVDQSLKVDADSYDFRVTPHITKQVRLGSSGIIFR